MNLICPVCGKPLFSEPRRYLCEKGHTFDRAKSGYVNLLLRQRHRQRGDDAEMAKARQTFLNAGYYQPLLERIQLICLQKQPQQLLDAGCGEGWYTYAVLQNLHQNNIPTALCGIDISPEILRFAANRAKQEGIAASTDWAVASVNRLPFAPDSCDGILNLFAPCEPLEFRRVLRSNGFLLRVIPLEKHLWELKKAVYDVPYENKPVLTAPEGFTLESIETLDYSITVPAAHLKALFAMTPYVHKTSQTDIAKLDALTELTTTVAFGIICCAPRRNE